MRMVIRSSLLRWRRLQTFWLLLHLLVVTMTNSTDESNKHVLLKEFYHTIAAPMYAKCDDPRRLLPRCIECIPGLHGANCDYVDETVRIRGEIEKLVRRKYGAPASDAERYALYPYLETSEFLRRQEAVGAQVAAQGARHVLDIGAYFNPIHLFFASSSAADADYCPVSVTVIEPILEALSVHIPCRGTRTAPADNPLGYTHVLFLPLTFKTYTKAMHRLPHSPDAVVCIGCDSYYGPTRSSLEETWSRPFRLYLEYSHDYFRNAPYNQMRGEGPGEALLSLTKRKFASAKEHAVRVMKVIHYSNTTTDTATTGR